MGFPLVSLFTVRTEQTSSAILRTAGPASDPNPAARVDTLKRLEMSPTTHLGRSLIGDARNVIVAEPTPTRHRVGECPCRGVSG